MNDLRQTPEYADYLQHLGWIVEKKDSIYYFIRKFPLIGSFIKIQRPDVIDFHKINTISKKNKAFKIVIEPKNYSDILLLKANKFRLNNSPFLPTKTLYLDLTQTENNLLYDMHYKTRYNIRIAKKRGIKIIISKNIDTFADFWQTCARKQRGVFISSKKEIREIYKAFGNKADLVFGLYKKELHSGILLIHADKISYYMYAASSQLGKNLFAPTLVTWKAVSISKKRGSKIFDFEGLYDDRFPLTSWKGFTRFKKSFGGKEVEYPGAYSKIYIPFL